MDILPPYRILELGIVHNAERRELFSEMTVMENLELGAYRAKGGKSLNRKLEYVFNLFAVIKERKTQQAGTLSGGEQQMVAIARGIIGHSGDRGKCESSGLRSLIKGNWSLPSNFKKERGN
jgi:branched-chain amino acid transport system ATP-binding protein